MAGKSIVINRVKKKTTKRSAPKETKRKAPRVTVTTTPEKTSPFWVVGVGSSAGGLEALSEFVGAITAPVDACFIVAQHLAPHAKSLMPELLGRETKIHVEQARHLQRLEPNILFVVPPNHDIDLKDGKICLTQAGEETRPKPSVDRFFSSLAREHGENAIAVVLSGSGSDGAEGIRAIRANGGLTMAQDTTAKYMGMPSAANDTGQVHFQLPAARLAEKICTIVREGRSRDPEQIGENEPGFQDILKLIRKSQGTDFSRYKLSTLKRRLAKRMSFARAESLAGYYETLQTDTRELYQLSQDLLVSVTSFFRDPESFEALRQKMREVVRGKNENEELRVWCAGCATGEEAYSLAIMLLELQRDERRHLNVKIFASDLDHDAIAHARLGIYSPAEVREVAPEILDTYFERKKNSYEVKKRVRDLVVFARQDIIQNPPFVKLDLISCRNVLIYFETDLQKKIFEIFHYALRPLGHMFLGRSELPVAAVDLFEVVDRKNKLYARKPGPSRGVPLGPRAALRALDTHIPSHRSFTQTTVLEKAQTQLLEQLGICGAVIEESGRILMTIGNLGSLLKMSSGTSDFSIFSFLHPNAAVELQMTLRKLSRGENDRAISRAYPTQVAGAPSHFTFSVTSYGAQPADEENRQFIVSFQPEIRKTPAGTRKVKALRDGELEHRLFEAEQELGATREQLQTLIEELGVANEELQSTNEELTSTNEELQSTNEELETTNEELQSTNEELTTLNEEMNVRSAELRVMNVDLENIQTSIGMPLVIVDAGYNIKRFNPSAMDIFDINLGDLNRSILKASCRGEIPDFSQMLKRTVEMGEAQEMQIEVNRTVYQMRILPSRNEDRQIIGAIILFIDNTELILAEEKWRREETRLRAIMNGTTSLVTIKDSLGKYLLVNKAFLDYFDFREDEVIGKTDRELLPEDLANEVRNADLECMLKHARLDRQERYRANDKSSVFLTNRFPLYEKSNANPYAVGTFATDVSRQYEIQRELEKSETLYRAVIEDQTVFVCRLNPDGRISFVNSAFCNYFGGNPAAYQAYPFAHLAPSRDREKVGRDLLLLKSSLNFVRIEHRLNQVDREVRWVQWMCKGIYGQEGELLEIQAVGFDNTEFRVQSDQIQQKEALFTHIFSHTTDFLTVFGVTADRELVLESFNRTDDRGGSYSYAHYVGRNVRELVDGPNREEILRKYRDCVELAQPQSFDEEIDLQGRVRFMMTTLVPVTDSENRVIRIAALSRDVSRFKQAENDLIKARDAAEVANLSKSDFLASMSHELRTPLNVVIGMSQMLEKAELKNEERKQLESIQRSGKVLLSLIEDILDLSRIEAGKVKLEYSTFSVPRLADEVRDIFKYQAEQKKIDLAVSLELGQQEEYVGDHARVRQVLINLVGNAMKFTDAGSVEIRISSAPTSVPNRKNLLFQVVDTGIGIPAESHGRIFQKFSQVESGLSRRYGGSGLGLVICKRLVTIMNGQVGFESEWGRGSRFWFELPLTVASKVEVRPAIEMANAGKAPTISVEDKRLRILAVDDSPDNLEVLQLFLRSLNQKPVLVSDAKEALKVMADHPFDLVFMDIQMPGMDGYQATEKIRAMENQNRGVPVIALTANAMVGDSERCFEAGMNDYLTKPYDLDKLRTVIEKWIN